MRLSRPQTQPPSTNPPLTRFRLACTSWWACHLLGGVAVAVNAWLTPEAFYHCVSITEPRALIVDAERAEVLGPKVASLRSLGCSSLLAARAPAPPAGFEPFVAALEAHEPEAFPRAEIGPEDDAIIFFTSGTTSLPKGVLSTQRQYLSNRWNTASGKVRAILRKGGDIPAPDPNAPQASVLLVRALPSSLLSSFLSKARRSL